MSTQLQAVKAPGNPDGKGELLGVLPRELGTLLIVAGIGGILLPGPVGSPFLVLGLVSLWPQGFGKLESGFRAWFPGMHRQGVKQIRRFMADLDRRYPSEG